MFRIPELHTLLPLWDPEHGWASGLVAWLVRWDYKANWGSRMGGQSGRYTVGEVGLRGRGERGRYRSVFAQLSPGQVEKGSCWMEIGWISGDGQIQIV